MIFENCVKNLSFENNQKCYVVVFLSWLDKFVAACILIDKTCYSITIYLQKLCILHS